MSIISNPISAWLNTQDSKFTPIGKSVLIPLELEVLEDWTEATIDFTCIYSDANHATSAIEIAPIVLKNHKEQSIAKTEVNLTVCEDGFYDVEAKITVILTDADSETGEDKLLTTFSFGVFSFQGKYIYDFSSQAALDKYAEIEALSKPNKEVKTLINLAETNKITSSDNKLTLDQMAEISRHIFAERQKIEDLYNNQYPSLLRQSQPFSLSLKKDQKATLKVRWPISNKKTDFLPLDKAYIVVEGDDDSRFKGELNNGEFSFIVPEDDFTFTATVFALYSDKFGVYKEDSNYDEIITTSFSNRLDYDITDGTAPFWSVFSAVMDLTDISKKHLNFDREKNRIVYVDIQGDSCFYRPKNQTININARRYYNWDVIAHEFGHAIANESSAIANAAGGSHSGKNQYDYSRNSKTLNNKKRSISLAFNEGYGTWVGIRLLKQSAYVNKMPYVGDDFYTKIENDGFVTYSLDLKDHTTRYEAYGEDAEFCIAPLLWQLSDQNKNLNTRALCSYKTDPISYSLGNIYNKIFNGKKLESISDFYKGIFTDYVGITVDFLRSTELGSAVNQTTLQKIHNLAMPFAEFGVGINIDDTKPQKIKKLEWSQLKTGSLPGHDQFDIYFFTNNLDTLVYKLLDQKIGKTKKYVQQKGTNYTYTLQKKDISKIESILSDKKEKEQTLYVLIAATATGKAATKGQIETGPYFSNLAQFQYTKPKKK